MADSEKETFLELIHDVDYSAEKLLQIFRTEMSDEEAVFVNSFSEMNLYNRQELLLHFVIVLTHHLDQLQGHIDTIAPVVADVADLLFTVKDVSANRE